MSKERTRTHVPELSIPLGIDHIPAAGLVQTIVASPKQREGLADRFGLLDLPSLRAELHVTHAPNGSEIHVDGTMTADVVQQCVATLEPLPNHIDHTINVVYTPHQVDHENDGMVTLADDAGEMEPIINGTIDLGELVSQHLGISLDPYPRKPGVEPIVSRYGTEDVPQNPFVRLADWAKNKEK